MPAWLRKFCRGDYLQKFGVLFLLPITIGLLIYYLPKMIDEPAWHDGISISSNDFNDPPLHWTYDVMLKRVTLRMVHNYTIHNRKGVGVYIDLLGVNCGLLKSNPNIFLTGIPYSETSDWINKNKVPSRKMYKNVFLAPNSEKDLEIEYYVEFADIVKDRPYRMPTIGNNQIYAEFVGNFVGNTGVGLMPCVVALSNKERTEKFFFSKFQLFEGLYINKPLPEGVGAVREQVKKDDTLFKYMAHHNATEKLLRELCIVDKGETLSADFDAWCNDTGPIPEAIPIDKISSHGKSMLMRMFKEHIELSDK